jgi:hypothetical protein
MSMRRCLMNLDGKRGPVMTDTAHNANGGLVEALRVMRQMIDVAEHRAFKSGLFMSAATTKAMQEVFTEMRAALTALEQAQPSTDP